MERRRAGDKKDALLHALDSDLSRYKAMYQSFNELEVQLRQAYQKHSLENLPAASRKSDDSWAWAKATIISVKLHPFGRFFAPNDFFFL